MTRYNYIFCLSESSFKKEVDGLLNELKSMYGLSLSGFQTLSKVPSYPLRDNLTRAMVRKVTYLFGSQDLEPEKVNSLMSTWKNRMKFPPLRVYVTKDNLEKVEISDLT